MLHKFQEKASIHHHLLEHFAQNVEDSVPTDKVVWLIANPLAIRMVIAFLLVVEGVAAPKRILLQLCNLFIITFLLYM